MAKKPEKSVKKPAAPKAKPKAAEKKPAVKAKPAPKAKVAPAKSAPAKKAPAKVEKKPDKNAGAKVAPKAAVAAKAPPAKASAAKAVDKAPKAKKVPSVMGSKPKKDADEMEDEFLDSDIEMDPELAEFVEDVAELEEADAEAEKADEEVEAADEEEVVAPKKNTKEKSATERRMKKERDLLAGIDRNGDLSEIWQKFYESHKSEKAKNYNMRETFDAKSPLQHVKLGWGFILSNINDRLEVLFKDGIKILISNYKT